MMLLKFMNMINIIRNNIICCYTIFLILVNIFVMHICSKFNLLIGLLSIDSSYSAVEFVRNNIDKDLTESQILTTNEKLYKIGIIERYVYYIGLWALYLFFSIFVLNNNAIIIKYLAGLTLVPIFFNTIVYQNLKKIFIRIHKEKSDLLRKICFEQIANVIVHLERITIGGDIIIVKSEIIQALNNIETIKNDAVTFVKNVLITSLLIYLRKNSRLYYKIVKYVYHYGFGEYIQDMNIEQATKLFEDVIKNKKYDNLSKPMFIQATVYLYCNREDTGEFRKYIKKFRFRILTMFSLWTIGSFCSSLLVLPIILSVSIGIIFSRKRELHKNIIIMYVLDKFKINFENNNKIKFIIEYIDDRTMTSLILTLLTCIFTRNPLILSVVNQFSGVMILNIGTFNLVRIIYINTNDKISKLLKNMHHDIKNIIKYVSISIMYVIYSELTHKIVYFIPLIFFVKNSNNIKILYPFFCMGLINNYGSIIKPIILGYILGVIDNFLILTINSVNKKDSKFTKTKYVAIKCESSKLALSNSSENDSDIGSVQIISGINISDKNKIKIKKSSYEKMYHSATDYITPTKQFRNRSKSLPNGPNSKISNDISLIDSFVVT